jgi:predicted SAM-dependent methyltransferase
MKFKSNLRDLFVFELNSLIGRVFFDNKPKLQQNHNYLNLGCGDNVIDGFINADFFYKTWKKTNQKKQWMLDLRYDLQCNDEVFDGVYSEHTLEHLTYESVENLLSELYRVLKKDSFIRITVPDCDKYVQFYHEKKDKDFNNTFDSKCKAISNLTQNHGHLSVWCFDEMKDALVKAGFLKVKKMKFQESQDDYLKLDIEDRKWETLYIEARK